MGITNACGRLFVAAAIGGVGLAGIAAPHAIATAGCRNDHETRNVWHLVPGPAGRDNAVLGQVPGDPCALVSPGSAAGYVSADGGTSWTSADALRLDVTSVVTQAMPAQTAFLVPRAASTSPVSTAPGLLVTHDAGRSVTAVTGLDGRSVRALATAPSDQREIVAITSPANLSTPDVPSVGALPNTPTVFVSQDFGNSFSPAPGSTALDPVAVAIDADTPSSIWVATSGPGPLAGLVESTDSGASFTLKDTTAATSVVTSKLAGGGSVVMSGTAGGIRRSIDGGQTFVTLSAGHDVRNIVLENDHPSAMMALVDGRIQRSSNAGRGFHRADDGLPSTCAARNLNADTDQPSTFLVTCSDGGTYRYRGDGADLASVDQPIPSGGVSAPASAGPAKPMQVLRMLRVPTAGAAGSGSVAFDGTTLYYTDASTAGSIETMSPVDGRYLGTVHSAIPRAIMTVTYDSLRDLLYAQDDHGNVYAVAPRTGSTTFMFVSPTANGGVGSISYDPSIDRFRGVADQGMEVLDFDRHGRVDYRCPVPAVTASAPSDPTDPNRILNPPYVIPGAAAIVASGDGNAYVEMENDQTVVHIDGSCQVLQQFVHPTYSEAGAENDSMACDTTTFSQPAIWMRDSDTATVQAYEVPGGYCALATTLTLGAPQPVLSGGSRSVCARLALAGRGSPLPGQPVNFFVNGLAIPPGSTRVDGWACSTYTARAATRQNVARSLRLPVLADFLGTIAYRPAVAHGEMAVQVPPLPPAPLPAPAPPLGPVAAAILPVAPLPPAPPAAPKPQPLAQAHPGAQPGVVGQPGAAADDEEEVEQAAQTADQATHEFSSSGAFNWPMVDVSAFAFAAALLELRRRRTRVREEVAC